jgi:hypothetical protein
LTRGSGYAGAADTVEAESRKPYFVVIHMPVLHLISLIAYCFDTYLWFLGKIDTDFDKLFLVMQAKLIQQLNAKRAEDGSAQIAALQEENAQLKEENEKMRSKLNAAAVSYTAVRAAMREENQVRKSFRTR